MSSIGKLFGDSADPRTTRSTAAAKANGLTVDVVPAQPSAGAGMPGIPVSKFEGTDGFVLTESRAIVKYIAALSDNNQLNGTDLKSQAKVDQWINFADNEIFMPLSDLHSLFNGDVPYNKTAEQRASALLQHGLTELEQHLAAQTFVVGHRLTTADLTVAANVYAVFTELLGEASRAKYPHTLRYVQLIVNQRTLSGVFTTPIPFAKEDAKFVPPKKEKKPEKPKEAAAPAAAVAAAADEEEEKPVAKAKNPLDALPKSTFNLEDWKRVYSNEDTRAKALPWFYEHFDADGYSIWRFDFKYNDELTQVFMSANQIGGFFTRLEGCRKYAMGTAGVFGKANDSTISGVVMVRGKDWVPVLSCAPDIESYDVTPLDLSKPEEKKFFEDMLAWEAVIDGREWADGKMLK